MSGPGSHSRLFLTVSFSGSHSILESSSFYLPLLHWSRLSAPSHLGHSASPHWFQFSSLVALQHLQPLAMRLGSLVMFVLFIPARLSTTHRAEIICLSQHAPCQSSPAPLEFHPVPSGPTNYFIWLMCLVLSIYFLSLQPPPTYFHSSTWQTPSNYP